MNDWRRQLSEAIDERFEQMRTVRRHLHANPEPSGEERQTSLYLYQLLAEEGLETTMGPDGRGVVVDLPAPAGGAEGNGSAGGGLIALRADIDALFIHEANDVPYKSLCPGVMHACGHDAHTALVVGATAALHDLRRSGRLPWAVPLRSIFQPAEETTEGARAMIEFGALDGVSGIMATHMDPSRLVGRIGLKKGVLTANCDDLAFTVYGRGGHGARPHEARDPIAAAAQLISSLYLFIPRMTNSQDAVVITIGQVVGGEVSNVIPEEVRLRGTLRTLDAQVRRDTMEHIQRLAHGIGETTETTIDVEFGQGSPSVRNDPRMIELLRRAGGEVLGREGLEEIPRPSMGSEDFAFYCDRTPGAMIRVGSAPVGETAASLHAATFDIDEEALRVGAKVLAHAAVLWADPARRSPADERTPVAAAERSA